MKIAITGTTSGVGLALLNTLKDSHDVISINRDTLDLSDTKQVTDFNLPHCDILVNCAGTGIGGKIDFANHDPAACATILNVNIVAPLLLTQKAIKSNPNCKIVNITSTNNNRFHPNDLVYSLSKQALSDFSKMLTVEYPGAPVLEVRLGLTKTNFNASRYQHNPERFFDIYQQHAHLESTVVAEKIVAAMFDNAVKFIEISP